MKLEYLGHACFLIDDGDSKVLIDPFLTGNGMASKPADQVETDHIFITHGHNDHIGDSVSIAKRTGATVYGMVELIVNRIAPEGVAVSAANLGGTQQTAFGSVKFVTAAHSCEESVPCGYIFTIGGKKIYHAGDTALIADMALLAEENIDIALLPIGGYYTMDAKDAVRAAAMIKPKMVIPMHYDTFPPIKQNPALYKKEVEEKGICAVTILNPGEVYNIV